VVMAAPGAQAAPRSRPEARPPAGRACGVRRYGLVCGATSPAARLHRALRYRALEEELAVNQRTGVMITVLQV
jgi:hypothetical protein